jgi:HemY protein
MELAEAALAAGRIDRARAALDPLRASGALSPRAYAAFEARVLAAALEDASGAAALNALWADLSRGQRYAPGVVAAYARRAAACGAGLAAQDEIETALASDWSPALVLAYADLDDGTLDARRRRAEQWLEAHPNDAALLVALGRMAVRQKQWSYARDWLERAVALEPSSLAWESLGDAHGGQGDVTRAATCYRNALRLARGEGTDALAGRGGRMDTRPIAVEERSELGVPRLPGGSPAPR